MCNRFHILCIFFIFSYVDTVFDYVIFLSSIFFYKLSTDGVNGKEGESGYLLGCAA